MKAVLDLKNAAFYLDTTADAIRDLVKQDRIPYKKRGERVIFLVAELDAWLQSLPGPSAADIASRGQIPARNTDTLHSNQPDKTRHETMEPTPLRLRKGRRQRHAVELPREQQR